MKNGLTERQLLGTESQVGTACTWMILMRWQMILPCCSQYRQRMSRTC